MSNDKLYARQICFLFLAFALPVKLITMPALAAKYAAEDLWISAAINFAPDLAMIFAICMLARKFEGQTVFEIVENKFGIAGKTIFSATFGLFFLFKAYLPLIEHRNFIEVALYETTPALWIFLPVFIFSAFMSYKGLRGAGRTADIAIWFTVSGIIVIAALSITAADVTNLLPIIDVPLGKIAEGSLNTSIWFFDSPYLLLCLGHFKPEKKQTKKIVLSYLGMALITLVYMAILQSEFGALTERQFFSPIKMGKYSVSVSNIGRIDYIAVCAIIFSCLFGCCLPLMFSTVCLENTFRFKHRIIPCLIVNGFMAAIIVLTEDYYFLIRPFFQNYLIPVFAVFTFVPLVGFFFKNNKNDKNGFDDGLKKSGKPFRNDDKGRKEKSCAF